MPTRPVLDDRSRQILEGLCRLRDQERREIKKLSKDPDIYTIACRLTDSLLANLKYLCHFNYVVGPKGKKTDIQDLFDPLETLIIKTFKELTGRDYEPVRVRGRDQAKKAKK